ncbi:hypothetical protein FCH28_22485 [Streptomyces piniterrae]|uniref:Uncharacterized protein n=1 Tax=Streptomyces piniterrae TaxID=2571125 RepID=A0A4U0N9G1_9ACTN|nr:hypothetical protein [Streptomyces piniterrae]TJZ50092.1 hypothetical protein FCH28_22485 [Streptomyces piniterrae]
MTRRTAQRVASPGKRTMSLAAASLVAGLAVFATACSGGVEPAGGKGGGSDANGKGKEADAAFKHRECLRDHGVQVQEPKPGEDPRSMVVGGDAKTDPETMKKAFKACQDSGPNAGKNGPSQADKDKALKYARCMRENGFNMPDPKFDDGMQKAMPIPQGAAKKKFDKANKTCGGQNAG